MYIFLTIFLVYVVTFLTKKDSKLFGDYDYFSRNNIFGLNSFNDNVNSEYESSQGETSGEEESEDEYTGEEDSEDEKSINSDDELVNSYDTLQNDLND